MPIVIDTYWKERVKSLKANNETWGAVRIYDSLRRNCIQHEGTYRGPSEATIGRILKNDWHKLDEEGKNNYRYVYWPETMEHEYLPWYMSDAALELLKLHWSEDSVDSPIAEFRKTEEIFNRPTVNDVKWFWRVSQALPDIGVSSSEESKHLRLKARWLVAHLLEIRDLKRVNGIGIKSEDAMEEVTRFLEEAMIRGIDEEVLGALSELLT